MDLFIALAIIIGLIVIPGLINYYVCRYFTPPGATLAPTGELVAASLTFTFALVSLDILGAVLISLVWDELKERISDFVNMGLLDFASDRPIALTGFLSAYAVAVMTFMGLLGALRVPSRWIR